MAVSEIGFREDQDCDFLWLEGELDIKWLGCQPNCHMSEFIDS